MKTKFSFYNQLIPIEETSEYLLYNILNGGLRVLDDSTGRLLVDLSNLDSFNVEDYYEFHDVLKELIDEGFLVDFYIDEKESYQQDYHNSQLAKYRNNSYIGLTIGTTILCNMGCPYCFQTVKPNKTLRDEKVINGIVTYIDGLIQKAPVKKWAGLSIMWYGGEPLINMDVIENLTTKFTALCSLYNIPYDASMVTNGILLTRETWQFLLKHQVNVIQITIDGAKEVHDSYRPLKSANGKNYEKILENLSMMPLGISATIRINTDKRVAATLPKLLDDLKDYGIWPQRQNQVSLKLAWLRGYAGADTSNMRFLTQQEFFDVENQFSAMLVERYNKWAKSNSREIAKQKWKLPEKQNDCATYVSPYFFTFDPEGGIHKCWETIHEKEKSSGSTVFKNWYVDDFTKYLNYSRTNVHPVCYNCKFNPVCEGLTCAYDTIHALSEQNFPCTPWKTEIDRYFKEMYLRMKENPDQVAIHKSEQSAHQTHSNK